MRSHFFKLSLSPLVCVQLLLSELPPYCRTSRDDNHQQDGGVDGRSITLILQLAAHWCSRGGQKALMGC